MADNASGGRITRGQWMALIAALLGWMFDGAEMGVFSMVGRPALIDLLNQPSDEQVGLWFGVITAGFLVGAATGGVLFGWLGDRIGRVRTMTLSVLTYAVFTGLCGLSSNAWQMGVLRFVAALGMGGEWSLGVALVMEGWPNRSRALMAGLIGAAGNLGYLLVGFVGLGLGRMLGNLERALLAVGLPHDSVETLVSNSGWRVLMICGTAPALLTFLIRLFVPESERWQQQQKLGRTSHWATADLLGVLVGALGPGLIIYLWIKPHPMALRLGGSLFGLVLAAMGYSYPVRRYLAREAAALGASRSEATRVIRSMLFAAGVSGVALLGTWGAMQWAPSWANKIGDPTLHPKEMTQIFSAAGAIVGTILAALMGDWLGRRPTYSLLCLASLCSLLFLYQGHTTYDQRFLAATFLAGLSTASFYGWLPLYLPELFRTNVRAIGQGFAYNFGRILAAVGALQVGTLFANEVRIGEHVFAGGYPFACSLISLVYLAGLGLIWLGPETRGQSLPE